MPYDYERNERSASLEGRLGLEDPDLAKKKGSRAKGLLALGALAGGLALARKGGVGPVLSGLSAGARSLEASNERERRRRLEDVIRRRDEEEQDMRRGEHERRMRDAGYIPAHERGPDLDRRIEGATLDDIVRAAVPGVGASSGLPVGNRDIEPRYGRATGGFVFDRTSPPARKADADARYAERRANRTDDDEASYTERRELQIQARIGELMRGGMSLDAANRKARLEAGSAVSSGRGTSPGAESPEVRDNRRAAQRNRAAAAMADSQIRALKREIGTVAMNNPSTATPEKRQLIAQLRLLEQRRDSLMVEHDKHSAAANEGLVGSGSSPSSPSEYETEMANARRAYEATLKQPGVDSAAVRRLYQQVVERIRAKYRVQ